MKRHIGTILFLAILLAMPVSVSAQVITLNPCNDTMLGTDLMITGTTTLADDASILITVEGPQVLEPKTVTTNNGMFTATYNTSNLAAGTYTVKADDLAEHMDTKKVNLIVTTPTPTPTRRLVEAAMSIFSIAETSTPTLTPTPTETPETTSTPTPTETTTPPQPGFEAVFAIAGLLTVAYLIRHRRR